MGAIAWKRVEEDNFLSEVVLHNVLFTSFVIFTNLDSEPSSADIITIVTLWPALASVSATRVLKIT